jgi:hypothetical protein
MISVYEMSSYLQIEDAIELCRNFFTTNICIENCKTLIDLSISYSDNQIEYICTKFLSSNWKNFIQSSYFLDLNKDENCLKIFQKIIKNTEIISNKQITKISKIFYFLFIVLVTFLVFLFL